MSAALEPVPNEVLLDQFAEQGKIETARKKAEVAVALAAPDVIRILFEKLGSADEQVQLRAADILLSRLLPKVAAKHTADSGDIIESVDKIALRESIEELMKRDR
jgi:hypothetical protein